MEEEKQKPEIYIPGRLHNTKRIIQYLNIQFTIEEFIIQIFYEEIIKYFKFYLLPPPTLANVELEFFFLTLLLTKLCSSISPQNFGQVLNIHR